MTEMPHKRKVSDQVFYGGHIVTIEQLTSERGQFTYSVRRPDGVLITRLPESALHTICEIKECNNPAKHQIDCEFICDDHAREWVKGEGLAAGEYQQELNAMGYGDL